MKGRILKMKKFKKMILALCVIYAVAYMLNHMVSSGIQNYRIKNDYEKAKIESYNKSFY